MSSPFQKSFSAKSPLAKHGEIKKALRKAKNENEQDFSYERVSELQSQFDAAKKLPHAKPIQDNIPSTADEQQSVANMNYEADGSAALKKGYVKRKEDKLAKTSLQINDLYNKRSSVKDVYLGDPDDLTTEKVRTPDKDASRRELRKRAKAKRTKKQIDS